LSDKVSDARREKAEDKNGNDKNGNFRFSVFILFASVFFSSACESLTGRRSDANFLRIYHRTAGSVRGRVFVEQRWKNIFGKS
jgi:hypothetical protein